ncbi:MAG: SH3 domain-containing protein [Clostridiales bacterium]|nr:SH3 domain-containing protein [Clostridiales bacterium]
MRKLFPFLAMMVLLVSMVPAHVLAETPMYYYVKTGDYNPLNLRESPSTDAAILVKIPYGARVELLDFYAGSTWANCTYKGYYGYVMTRYLSYDKPYPKPDPGPKPAPQPSGSLFVGFQPAYYSAIVRPSTPAGFVHMRWAPSKDQPIFQDYYAGQPLQVFYANNTWCQVYDPNTHVFGYMMKEFLTYVGPIGFGEGMVGDAQ